MEKNQEYTFLAQEGESEWSETKSYISGYNLNEIERAPKLVSESVGDTEAQIRFSPPCNYVGDLGYEFYDNNGTWKIKGRYER